MENEINPDVNGNSERVLAHLRRMAAWERGEGRCRWCGTVARLSNNATSKGLCTGCATKAGD